MDEQEAFEYSGRSTLEAPTRGCPHCSPLGMFTESLPAPAMPWCRLPHGYPGTGAQSSPSTVQSVQRGLLVRVSVGAEQPWRVPSPLSITAVALVRAGLGEAGPLGQKSSAVPRGQMFDDTRSGDKKETQTLGECAGVYAAKIQGPETACLCGCRFICTENSHIAVYESSSHQHFNLSLCWPFC